MMAEAVAGVDHESDSESEKETELENKSNYTCNSQRSVEYQ